MRTVGRADISNIRAVARREFLARVTTRVYRVTTVALILGAALLGLAPVAISYLNREATHVAVYVGAPDLRGDPVATLEAVLGQSAAGGAAGAGGGRAFTVTRETDLAGGRRQVSDGTLTALLEVGRDGSGEPVITIYTTARDTSSVAAIGRQAALAIAVADRLGRSGASTAEQAALLAAPVVAVRPPDDAGAGQSSAALVEQQAGATTVFALELFLLIAIILYSNWIAQSVAEEKGSRMIEIILSTATPLQFLAGKVLGVSAAALAQFAAVIAASLVALLAEGQVAAFVLGTAGVDMPAGLTPGVLAGCSVFFLLGFLLYAALFAAAGSLAGRLEDVTQAVQPMTLLACGGYLVAMYGSIGIIDAGSPLVAALSWLPLVSPYTMTARIASGQADVLETAVAGLLLAATAAAVAWLASRIYAASVLMSGQRPSVRAAWAALRTRG